MMMVIVEVWIVLYDGDVVGGFECFELFVWMCGWEVGFVYVCYVFSCFWILFYFVFGDVKVVRGMK